MEKKTFKEAFIEFQEKILNFNAKIDFDDVKTKEIGNYYFSNCGQQKNYN